MGSMASMDRWNRLGALSGPMFAAPALVRPGADGRCCGRAAGRRESRWACCARSLAAGSTTPVSSPISSGSSSKNKQPGPLSDGAIGSQLETALTSRLTTTTRMFLGCGQRGRRGAWQAWVAGGPTRDADASTAESLLEPALKTWLSLAVLVLHRRRETENRRRQCLVCFVSDGAPAARIETYIPTIRTPGSGTRRAAQSVAGRTGSVGGHATLMPAARRHAASCVPPSPAASSLPAAARHRAQGRLRGGHSVLV